MREDQLSPQLGRLIDAARSALAGCPLGREAVALVAEDGRIFTGCGGAEWAAGACGAAEAALKAFAAADARSIDAAALAANSPDESFFPCPGCHAALSRLDPDLPLVIRQLGRWIILPLSSLREQS
jgi:cytidine deaminase